MQVIMPNSLCWVLGIELRCFSIQVKHLSHWAIPHACLWLFVILYFPFQPNYSKSNIACYLPYLWTLVLKMSIPFQSVGWGPPISVTKIWTMVMSLTLFCQYLKCDIKLVCFKPQYKVFVSRSVSFKSIVYLFIFFLNEAMRTEISYKNFMSCFPSLMFILPFLHPVLCWYTHRLHTYPADITTHTILYTTMYSLSHTSFHI